MIVYLKELTQDLGFEIKIENLNEGMFSTTKKRFNMIKSKCSIVKECKTHVYITNNTLNEMRHECYRLFSLLDVEIKKSCASLLEIFTNDFEPTFSEGIVNVAELDLLVSRALHRLKNNKTCQVMYTESTSSFVKGTNIVHPIVNEYKSFVGNDAIIDSESPGHLIFGINGSGKSTYGKSVAINVVLAQVGFDVFASSFEISPFHTVFTRINSDDDVYRQMSSFAVEMSEMRNILNLSNEHSLVVGDELCKGTEHVSALSIVAACIQPWILQTYSIHICNSSARITEITDCQTMFTGDSSLEMYSE